MEIEAQTALNHIAHYLDYPEMREAALEIQTRTIKLIKAQANERGIRIQEIK